jgi:hypothetical protein
MCAARLARYSLAAVCGATLLLASTGNVPVAAQAPGLKIVVRETDAFFIREITTYLQAGRKREEWRIVPGSARSRGAAIAPQDQRTGVMITRCDWQRQVVLDLEQRAYTSRPIDWRPSALQGLLMWLTYRRAEPRRTPNLLIETTTVDTGERKRVFGRTARRVVTTRKQVPLPAGVAESDEMTMDGWYVDLDADMSCEPRRKGARLHAVAVGTSSGQPLPVITFKDVGTLEDGYAVELTTTWPLRSVRLQPDPTARLQPDLTTHRIVTEWSTGPLEPELFEIPKGFRPAEGRFATLAAEVSTTWYLLKAAAASYF